MKNETLDSNPAGRPGGTVLIIDDEIQNRALLRDPLEARGFQVAEAVNGAEALEHIAHSPPDVILLDLMMPGMNGYEVCQRLKRDPATAPIPILMVTALSDRKERLLGIQAGANDFLNKPIDVQDLILRVTNAAYSKALFEELRSERAKSERLLLNVLPAAIAERMRSGEVNIADQIGESSIMVCDLVGFTTLASHVAAEQVVFLLNEIFSAFDSLSEKHGLEKIKTMGDAYLVAGGIPAARENQTEAMAQMAFDMLEEIRQFNRQYSTSILIRIGISTGPVVAGVIGRKKFTYDVWGDTVNVAFRLGTAAQPGQILVDDTTFARLEGRCRFDPWQNLDLKGRGEVTVHRLLERTLTGPAPTEFDGMRGRTSRTAQIMPSA